MPMDINELLRIVEEEGVDLGDTTAEEIAAVRNELIEEGLVEVCGERNGQPAYRLTPAGQADTSTDQRSSGL